MTQLPVAEERSTVISRIASILLVLFSAYMWYRILLVLALAPPPYEEMLGRFNTPGGLPLLTQALIAASHAVTSYWYLFAAAGLVAAVILVWMGSTKRCVGSLAILAAASFGGIFAMGFLMFEGLLIPILRLMITLGLRR